LAIGDSCAPEPEQDEWQHREQLGPADDQQPEADAGRNPEQETVAGD
jgi:hypothetical protein